MSPSTFARDILTCHACRHRQARCMGSCACLKDGRDIIEHAQSHQCPEERFNPRGLGDSIAWILQRLGVHRLIHLYRSQTSWQHRSLDGPLSDPPGCGCANRRAALNTWVRYR